MSDNLIKHEDPWLEFDKKWCEGNPFWILVDVESGKRIYILELGSWNIYPYIRDKSELVGITIEDRVIKGSPLIHFSDWKIPSVSTLKSGLRHDKFPLTGQRGVNRLFGYSLISVLSGVFDLDDCSSRGGQDTGGIIYPVSTALHGLSFPEVIEQLIAKGLVMISPDDDKWRVENSCWPLIERARHYDSLVAGLPRIPTADITDPSKGLWEAWSPDDQGSVLPPARERNPNRDARHENIAIDFGTSSTVVARETENGSAELVLISAEAYHSNVDASSFENPTIVEILDANKLLAAWNQVAYRPPVVRDAVRVSHEALDDVRNNATDVGVLGSTIRYLKRWALFSPDDGELGVIDRLHGREIRIPQLTGQFPVRGSPIQSLPDGPLDPVELYAFYLGLYINYRQRGLYTNYYMTFPVKYPRSVRQHILASFSRGLQRSLPESFTRTESFSRLSVSEIASEPAAYAISALEALSIRPSQEGVYYAVFDFGGGTSDFDYGLYRLPNEEERLEEWECVFEHFGSSGDRYLGGENILEGMAFLVFSHNEAVCREKGVMFTRSRDARMRPSVEVLVDGGQRAQVNTVIMMEYLRQFWEGEEELDSSLPFWLDMTGKDGEKVSCELSLPADDLREYIRGRIRLGVEAFIAGMQISFQGKEVSEVQVLLGGNASKSKFLLECFDNSAGAHLVNEANADRILNEDVVEGQAGSGFVSVEQGQTGVFASEMLNKYFDSSSSRVNLSVYPPLALDHENPYAPTAKTGVALGLLKLHDGGGVKIINHYSDESQAHTAEAPFAFYVGRCFEGLFAPSLSGGDRYNHWHHVGVIRGQAYDLFYTQLPLAATGGLAKGHPRLLLYRVSVPSEARGKHLAIKALGPNLIAVGYGESPEAIEKGHVEDVSEHKLS